MPTKLLDLNTERRDAILNSALKEFTLRGFDDASTNVIAKEAGISKALMFHYVSNKQELFLVVYDFFSNLMKKDYFELINYDEKDIFNRLRQSYILQIKLMEKYPWILEYSKLSSKTRSSEINREIEKRRQEEYANCYPKLFDDIDISQFRKELDIEKCKQIIFWSNIGFTNQLLDEIRNTQNSSLNSRLIINKLDNYFDEFKKIFYVAYEK